MEGSIKVTAVKGRCLINVGRPRIKIKRNISEEHKDRSVDIGERKELNRVRRKIRTNEIEKIKYRRINRMSDQEREECTQEILRVFGKPKETRPPLNELLNISIAVQRPNPFRNKPPRDINIQHFIRAPRSRLNKKDSRIGHSLIINGKSQDRINLQQIFK